jgi:hypothetical protein
MISRHMVSKANVKNKPKYKIVRDIVEYNSLVDVRPESSNIIIFDVNLPLSLWFHS